MNVTLPRSLRGTSIQVFEIGATITVSVVATTAQSAVFTEDTIVRLVAVNGLHLAVGTNPTATSSNMFIPPNTPMIVEIKSGDRFAAIRDASDSTLFITTML